MCGRGDREKIGILLFKRYDLNFYIDVFNWGNRLHRNPGGFISLSEVLAVYFINLVKIF